MRAIVGFGFVVAAAGLAAPAASQTLQPLHLENRCSQPVRLFYQHQDEAGRWVTSGWYRVPARTGGAVRLERDGRPLLYRPGTDLYFFGEITTPGISYVWQGPRRVPFDGAEYGLLASGPVTESQSRLSTFIHCDNLPAPGQAQPQAQANLRPSAANPATALALQGSDSRHLPQRTRQAVAGLGREWLWRLDASRAARPVAGVPAAGPLENYGEAGLIFAVGNRGFVTFGGCTADGCESVGATVFLEAPVTREMLPELRENNRDGPCTFYPVGSGTERGEVPSLICHATLGPGSTPEEIAAFWRDVAAAADGLQSSIGAQAAQAGPPAQARIQSASPPAHAQASTPGASLQSCPATFEEARRLVGTLDSLGRNDSFLSVLYRPSGLRILGDVPLAVGLRTVDQFSTTPHRITFYLPGQFAAYRAAYLRFAPQAQCGPAQCRGDVTGAARGSLLFSLLVANTSEPAVGPAEYVTVHCAYLP